SSSRSWPARVEKTWCRRRGSSVSCGPANGCSSCAGSTPGCVRTRSTLTDGHYDRIVDDRAVVERQLGRPPRSFRRVVRRSPSRSPGVTGQSPCDVTGEPFPTTYYLTCRHLVAELSRLEAAGGVERWSARLAEDPELAESLARATELQRTIRHDLAGG